MKERASSFLSFSFLLGVYCGTDTQVVCVMKHVLHDRHVLKFRLVSTRLGDIRPDLQ